MNRERKRSIVVLFFEIIEKTHLRRVMSDSNEYFFFFLFFFLRSYDISPAIFHHDHPIFLKQQMAKRVLFEVSVVTNVRS